MDGFERCCAVTVMAGFVLLAVSFLALMAL
jgi:hypothetical protein